MFTEKSSIGQGTDLIPNGTLAWVSVTVREIKKAAPEVDQHGNVVKEKGQYLDLEMTVVEGPYIKRKIWDIASAPSDMNNSEGARKMGEIALSRILESCGVCIPGNSASYEQFNGKPIEDVAMTITAHAGRVGVKIRIEAGKNGYSDRNKVAEWLTPNPASHGYANYQKLTGSGPETESRPAMFRPAVTTSVAVHAPLSGAVPWLKKP